MLRTAFFLALLGLLAVAPASAHQAGWPFWFGRPEHNGSRKTPGDYTHARGSYRHHSRTRRGFFSFLHFSRQHPGISHQRGSQPSHHAKVY